MTEPIIIRGALVRAVRSASTGFVVLSIDDREVWLDEEAARLAWSPFRPSRAARDAPPRPQPDENCEFEVPLCWLDLQDGQLTVGGHYHPKGCCCASTVCDGDRL